MLNAANDNPHPLGGPEFVALAFIVIATVAVALVGLGRDTPAFSQPGTRQLKAVVKGFKTRRRRAAWATGGALCTRA